MNDIRFKMKITMVRLNYQILFNFEFMFYNKVLLINFWNLIYKFISITLWNKESNKVNLFMITYYNYITVFVTILLKL